MEAGLGNDVVDLVRAGALARCQTRRKDAGAQEMAKTVRPDLLVSYPTSRDRP